MYNSGTPFIYNRKKRFLIKEITHELYKKRKKKQVYIWNYKDGLIN